MPAASVLDATAGIGSDSLALASQNLRLLSSDLDPLHAACVRKNLERLGFSPRVVIADAAHPPARTDALFIDPDRRADNMRLLNPEQWSPTLSRCLQLASTVRGACFKLAPALDTDELVNLPGNLRHSWQWTSADGELVEVTLWTGLLSESESKREIQALRRGRPPAHYSGEPVEDFHLSRADALEVAWISEPDPTLIRSRLLTRFARERELSPIGPSIAYLGSVTRPEASPWLKSWRVIDSEAADRRRVRALLRRHDLGEVTVKKRGHPRSAAELAREFRGKGPGRGTLIVTRLEKGHRAYLVEPAQPPERAPDGAPR